MMEEVLVNEIHKLSEPFEYLDGVVLRSGAVKIIAFDVRVAVSGNLYIRIPNNLAKQGIIKQGQKVRVFLLPSEEGE